MQCKLFPIDWLGENAVLLSFYEIEDKIIKTNLLVDQSVSISCQLREVLKMLENDVNDKQFKQDQSFKGTSFDKKEMLKKLIRVFNNFSFIKNVFEIDAEDFCLEYECFTLKDSLMYCLNFMNSSYPNVKIDINIDPCLPKDVEGDVTKFHQIMISLIDFALKSTDTVYIDLKAEYEMKLGGFIVYFEISFISGITYDENDLKTMFSITDDVFIQNINANKSIGLPLNLTARILKIVGGSFNRVSLDREGRTVLNFQIPFRMADFSNYPYVHIPTLHNLLEQSSSKDSFMRQSKFDNDENNINFQNNQESGNEGSLQMRSNDVIESVVDNLKPIINRNKKEWKSKTVSFQKKDEIINNLHTKDRMASTQKHSHSKSPEMRLAKEKADQEAGQIFSQVANIEKPSVKEETKNESKEETKEKKQPQEINLMRVTFSDEIKQNERTKNTCPMSTKSKNRMLFKDRRLGKYSFNMKNQNP